MRFMLVVGVCVTGPGEARGQAPATGPSTRPIVIAKDTTRATSPVTADGRVDYFGGMWAYPAEVAALLPGYLKAVPVDWFNVKPLVYQNSGEAFVLYSVGSN